MNLGEQGVKLFLQYGRSDVTQAFPEVGRTKNELWLKSLIFMAAQETVQILCLKKNLYRGACLRAESCSNVRLETCPLFKSKLLLVFDLYVAALFSCMGGTLFHSKIWQFYVTWRIAKHTGFVVYNSILKWNHYYPLWISAKLFQWVWLIEVACCVCAQLKCHKLNGNRWKLTSKSHEDN